MTVVGYARVSTDHQSLDQQRDALTAAGCERVFTDQLSGVRTDRRGLVAMLQYVRTGDTVVVASLDRLGRSVSGVIRTIETLTEAGVLLKSLREGIDYSTATGRMLAGIFAALAGYERELMHERTTAARVAARVLLLGLALNTLLGWSWADPIAALVIAGVAVREGLEAWRGDNCCSPAAALRPGAAEQQDGCGCRPGCTDACCTTNATTTR